MAGASCSWSQTAKTSRSRTIRNSGQVWKVIFDVAIVHVKQRYLTLKYAARGYTLTFRDLRNTAPSSAELLTRYEEKQFDGAVIFAPSAKSRALLPVQVAAYRS